ncbi:hypothetical protein H6P81_019978 [Aristolochia fimbriata]|uniref:Uncharacterized protein n=1 Tax=Aristolochia fimbriata TaxID=158543 RepID=A0AAV7DU57_ARIFI|nr:hypothetical protein H6P81_019978 [Aristolochia fimbriata]
MAAPFFSAPFQPYVYKPTSNCDTFSNIGWRSSNSAADNVEATREGYRKACLGLWATHLGLSKWTMFYVPEN